VLIGHMSGSMSLGAALGIDAGAAYGLVVVAALMLPDTRRRVVASRHENGAQAISRH
jgi:hypothetical protein